MPFRFISAGLRRLLHQDVVDRELQEEIDHYLALSAREKVRRGTSQADAERAARIQFGGVEAVKDQLRASGWESAVDTLWRDVRYATRGMRRNPGFTAVACITLALGVGATTAMFSVVNAVVLRPLPYHDARRLVQIWTDDRGRGLHREHTASRTIADWRDANHTLTDVAFYNAGRATIGEGTSRERTRGVFVSGNLFSVLGVVPLRGRALSPVDEREAADVVVISHSLWQRRFGGDSTVVGKSIYMEDAGKGTTGFFRIVGVMPAGFYFPDRQTELWRPATTYWRFQRESVERFADWARRWVAVARLKPGVTLDDARSDLATLGRRLAESYASDRPDFPGFVTTVEPMLDGIAGRNLQTALWLLLGAVSLVLLVACANTANLLLARGAARQHEFALRRALGGSRFRLVRQLVVESLVLATVGGAIGVALALVGTRLLVVTAATQLPRVQEVGIDSRVLVFAAAVSLASGILFGIVPALRISGADSGAILNEGRGVGDTRRGRRVRGLLVAAECAVTIVLLAGAGLVLRSLERLHAVDPGFDPRSVLTVRIEFPAEHAPSGSEAAQGASADQMRARARQQALNALAARIGTLPAVENVGFVDDMFITGAANKSIAIPGRSDSANAGELNDGAVTPGFFRALRVPLERGRYLTNEDADTKIRALWSPVVAGQSLAQRQPTAPAEPVVVNDAFARRFFPNEDPIGKRFCIDPTNKTYWYEIVGVVGDMHRQGLDRRAVPEFFGPLIPMPSARSDLLVRTSGDPMAMASTIREMVLSMFPGGLVNGVSTAERQMGGFNAERNLQAWLFTTFALLALSLAAVGTYGVVQFGVAERTREIGVRIALGAAPPEVVRMIVGQGMRAPVLGLTIGVVTALALTRLIAGLLFGTSPADPVTFAMVALVLSAVALSACLIPARRAASLSPAAALRHD